MNITQFPYLQWAREYTQTHITTHGEMRNLHDTEHITCSTVSQMRAKDLNCTNGEIYTTMFKNPAYYQTQNYIIYLYLYGAL